MNDAGTDGTAGANGTAGATRGGGDPGDVEGPGGNRNPGPEGSGETSTPGTGDPADREEGLRERLRYLLVLSRPRFWFYLAGPVVVGVAYGADSLGELLSPQTIALFAYFLLPANVLLYGINDLFDREIDAENPKKEGREARWRGGRDVFAAVLVSGLLGLAVLVASPPAARLWVAVFLLLSAGYSAPPARFKTTPLLDSLSNGLYLCPGVAAYAALAGAWPPLPAIVGGWLWTMAMHTFSAIPDIEPDRAAGIRTTATVLGRNGTLAYCALVWSLAAVAFGLVDARLGLALALYPLLAVAWPLAGVAVERAYWYYPAVNTLFGMALTLAALVRFSGAVL